MNYICDDVLWLILGMVIKSQYRQGKLNLWMPTCFQASGPMFRVGFGELKYVSKRFRSLMKKKTIRRDYRNGPYFNLLNF
jgi:hypothetical protein